MIKKTEETNEIKIENIIKKYNEIHYKNKNKNKHKKHKKIKEIKLDNKINKNMDVDSILNNKNIYNIKKDIKEKFHKIEQSIEDKSIKAMNNNIFYLIKKSDNYIKDFIEQKDFEINSLDYEDAIKVDHRNFFEYYISLIKNNHPLLFSFASYKDYNIRIIKIFLFFFSFSLNLSINALFFNDETMHKIYEDKGKYNFLYQIPQILYATLISKLIVTILKILALTRDVIVDLKKEDKKNLNKIFRKKLVRKLKIKFILFFIISFIILLFVWYYLICFCGIYVNTQIHLISDCFMSLLTSFIYPFVILLIPGIFRISSLKVDKPSRKCIYKFSSLIGK